MLLAAPALGGSFGCAGGVPLLHPAQVLPQGDVRVVSGGSAHVAVGGAAAAVSAAEQEVAAQPAGSPTPSDAKFAKGALVEAAIAPGVAPFVGARIGLPHDFEGGIVYTGRSIRADGRHAFTLSQGVALSVGLGGSALIYGQGDGTTLPDVDTSNLHGYGADIPILIGYESDAGILHAWAGVRAAYEHVTISALSSDPSQAPLFQGPTPLSADHWSAGGLIGMSVGLRHIHVAIELDAAYENVKGTWGPMAGDTNAQTAQISGLSLTPGAAAWWTF